MHKLRILHLRLIGLLLAAPLILAIPVAEAGSSAMQCSAIKARVDDIPGGGPVFLASYGSIPGEPDDPALDGAAFTYDNALAVMALSACGHREEARRIGDAILAASAGDRTGEAGRVRNAYRAGAVGEYPPPPMGWWDRSRNAWLEDPYQVGSSTGNLAWAGLALLTLHDETGEVRYRDGAARIAQWAMRFSDAKGIPGFIGGLQGFDAEAQPLTWKSTEHNTDMVAFLDWLDRAGGGKWDAASARAKSFVAAMFRPAQGRFLIGTAPDGATPAEHPSGLDAQLWPLLLDGAQPAWRAAFDYALKAHGADGGLDFNDDRDGLWSEGTAQGALVARALGRKDEAHRLRLSAAEQAGPEGYIFASKTPSISTGLAIGPNSATDDFRYYHRPHLGATAWTVLAARGWNPFTGRRVD